MGSVKGLGPLFVILKAKSILLIDNSSGTGTSIKGTGVNLALWVHINVSSIK
jgi:hypothetical protein